MSEVSFDKRMHNCLQKCCSLVGMLPGDDIFELPKRMEAIIKERNSFHRSFYDMIHEQHKQAETREYRSRYDNE